MDDISRLIERVEGLQPKKDSLNYICNTFENLIEYTLAEYQNSLPDIHTPKSDTIHDTASEYVAASFINFILSSKHSDKTLHSRKTKGINEMSSAFIGEVKQYFYNNCKDLLQDIKSYNASLGTDVTNPPVLHIRLLTELNTICSKSRAALAYQLENKKSEYDRGLITALYNALSSDVALKNIRSALLSSGHTTQSKESVKGQYPKFREYWDVTKGLRTLIKKDVE